MVNLPQVLQVDCGMADPLSRRRSDEYWQLSCQYNLDKAHVWCTQLLHQGKTAELLNKRGKRSQWVVDGPYYMTIWYYAVAQFGDHLGQEYAWLTVDVERSSFVPTLDGGDCRKIATAPFAHHWWTPHWVYIEINRWWPHHVPELWHGPCWWSFQHTNLWTPAS